MGPLRPKYLLFGYLDLWDGCGPWPHNYQRPSHDLFHAELARAIFVELEEHVLCAGTCSMLCPPLFSDTYSYMYMYIYIHIYVYTCILYMNKLSTREKIYGIDIHTDIDPDTDIHMHVNG